jgi:hypothetical protein
VHGAIRTATKQSKLLLAKPETVIAMILDHQETPSEAAAPQPRARKPAAPGAQLG